MKQMTGAAKILLFLFLFVSPQFSSSLVYNAGRHGRRVDSLGARNSQINSIGQYHFGRVGSVRHMHNGNAAATVAALLRGGGGGFSQVTAKACSAFLGFNAVTLLLFPNKMLKDVYNIEPDDGSVGDFATWLMRAIGVVGMGVSINVYSSIIKGSSARLSIGLGLLPRLVFSLGSLASMGSLKKFGLKSPFLTFNTAVTLWTTVAILFKIGNPALSARVFSCMAIMKASLFVFDPSKACSNYLGVNVAGKEMDKPRALCRGLGNELLTSAVLMACLAFGIDPVKAAGYTSILWAILLLDMAFLDKTWRLMGSDGPRAQIVHICISSALAAGFLL